jgi:hypothetical protein
MWIGRWLGLVGWFMGVGLASTVAVAVGASLCHRYESLVQQTATAGLRCERLSTVGWSEMTTTIVLRDEHPSPRDAALSTFEAVKSQPFLVGTVPLATPPRAPRRTWWFVQAGWPTPAFWGWRCTDTGLGWKEQMSSKLLPAPRLVMSTSIRNVDIPYGIQWTGLIANVALYAVLWALLVSAYMALRSALRRRRGLCPACGYDCSASGMVCPECGAGVSPATTQSPASA